MNYEFIGTQMRRARNARGLTQAQLAEKASLAANYIGTIERGTSIPSLPTTISICEILGINLDYLIGIHIPANREAECIEYEQQIIEIIKTFDKRQLLCLLDAIELIQKYSSTANQLYD